MSRGVKVAASRFQVENWALAGRGREDEELFEYCIREFLIEQ